jgi:hypothetical protein
VRVEPGQVRGSRGVHVGVGLVLTAHDLGLEDALRVPADVPRAHPIEAREVPAASDVRFRGGPRIPARDGAGSPWTGGADVGSGLSHG